MSDEYSKMLIREYPANTVVFREGDEGSTMYVIRKGKVKISRFGGGSEIVLAFLGDGDFFGEMALLEGLPRSATATVMEDSIFVEVELQTFEEMVRRNIEIAVRMMRKLAGRVRELDRRLETVLIEDAQVRAIEVLRWLIPHGVLDGAWFRVENAVAHLDIAVQAGIPQDQAVFLLSRLEAAGILHLEGDDLLIAQTERLDEYSSFLEMKRRYASISSGDTAYTDPSSSMKNLLRALSLQPNEIDKRQEDLAEKYQRYLLLKKKFRDLESISG